MTGGSIQALEPPRPSVSLEPSVRPSACQPLPLEVRAFWLNPRVLACALKRIFPRDTFLNQINKDMGGILGPALGPKRCLQD